MIERAALTSNDYLAISSAVEELEKNKLELSKYKLFLYIQDNQYVVVFQDPNFEDGQRGSSPKITGFEVVVNRNHQVISSNFVR